MKPFITSILLSGGFYFGYQLKFGSYSGCGDILEVKNPAKRLFYYQIEESYFKSEMEVSKFITDMTNKNIFGTFHKIQLPEQTENSSNKIYLIGVEETLENTQKLTFLTDRLKVKEIPEFQAVQTHLNYEQKNPLFVTLQMTFNVQNFIKKYVEQNQQKFPGINLESYLKTITIGSNKQFLQASVSYPFGQNSLVFKELLEHKTEKEQPKQEQVMIQQNMQKSK